MVLYELMTLKYPYYEIKSPVFITKAILAGQIPLLTPDILEKFKPIISLWKSCLNICPELRLTALQLRDELFKLIQNNNNHSNNNSENVNNNLKNRNIEEGNVFKLLTVNDKNSLRKSN